MTVIRRKPEANFTIIPNEMAQGELGAAALGVATYLLSHPGDWIIRRSDIERRFKKGRDWAYKVLKELEQAGYLRREQTKSEGGKFSVADYEIDSIPGFSPCTPLPDTVSPYTENPTHTKNNTKQTNNNTKDSCDFEKFWRVYPKRNPHPNGSKKTAQSTFKTKIKNGTTPDEIISGASAYANQCAELETEPQFICTAQTWLNQERWTDVERIPEKDFGGAEFVEG